MTKLVLLPGLDGTGDLFDPFIHAVSGEWSVQVVRYPKDKILCYRELVRLVRETLPKDAPYFVLGESFSGPIAIELAAEAPPQMQGLILCCSFARNPRPIFSTVGRLLPPVQLNSYLSSLLSWALLGESKTDALQSAIFAAVAQVSPSVLHARLQEVLAVDVLVSLSSVKLPCLYLQAAKDKVVPKSAAALIKRTLPSVKVVEIHSPHCLLQVAPAEAVASVSDFLKEIQLAL